MVVVLFIVALIMLLFLLNQNKAIGKLEAAVASTQESLDEAKATEKDLSQEFDAKAHQKTIKERTVSAKGIAKEIIAVDDTLTAFYKTSDPMPKDKKKKQELLDSVEKAKEENTKLTGAEEADQIKTLQLNPDWTMKLESVVTYQDTNSVPILFSMKTKKGKDAGLIYAIYNVDSHKLTNISRHYTTDGLADEVSVGGV